jgi:hypothetical protein
MVSPNDHVVMNHQNQTRTNGIWGHVRYSYYSQIEEWQEPPGWWTLSEGTTGVFSSTLQELNQSIVGLSPLSKTT